MSLTREQIEELIERSKNDRAIVVGSEVRVLGMMALRSLSLAEELEKTQAGNLASDSVGGVPDAEPTEAQVAAGAEVLSLASETHIIECPQLPPQCWMGLSWAVLKAAALSGHAPETTSEPSNKSAVLEKMGKDAERYQWLREHCDEPEAVVRVTFVTYFRKSGSKAFETANDSASLDAAIDAAMSASKETPGREERRKGVASKSFWDRTERRMPAPPQSDGKSREGG